MNRLEPVYGHQEAASLFKMVGEELLGLKPFEITMARNRVLPQSDLEVMEGVLDRLSRQEPLQYILGKAWFKDMWLKVNSHTLIPRQETEELVQWIIDDGLDPQSRVLDVGTGSGCIAIALKKHFPESLVYALDKSAEALAVAQFNAGKQNTEVNFSECDILELMDLSVLLKKGDTAPFDVVVSNPPYVRNLEKKEIHKNVLEHEPASALFVSDRNPLIFYRKIAKLASQHLMPGGRLYFEINQYLGRETYDLVSSEGFSEVTLRKDLLGNHRMLKAIK
ncbi:peptide chain release factor N(5)-glutamine methyltransferase [Robertkochia flava]|uniref:peptide chain release factor N(5)-glutamine methyltransferase n=1 Tax=Robertkochia flava TaxID=3447986 RepID=UPI001CC99450|nr:peptide chain release factor N(5)-glutamine methyltransferase [Robertkochia marina]